MKSTPKTDEVIAMLEQATTVINLMEYCLKEIEDADNISSKTDEVIAAYQSNLNYCHSCEVTAKDIYDEYWAICQSVESLPMCARALAVRFENVGIPVWVCEPNNDYQIQVNNKLNSLVQQGNITKSQESDLICLFDLLINWIRAWVFRARTILREMGVTPNPLLTEELKQNENYTETAENEITLPSELDTEQARKYFAKAINVKYMQKEDDGYKWLFGGDKGQARLGYFCNRAFTPPRPINKLEEIFGAKKLSASITNADNEAKRADVKKWRDEMDNNIFND